MRAGATAALTGFFAFFGVSAALAAPEDQAQAEALMLSGGSALLDLDTVATLAGPYNAYPPGDAEQAALDVTAVGLLNLGLGLTILGGSPSLGLGAVNQYAATSQTGAVAAAGAVDNTGAIVAGGAPTTLDLAPVLGAIPGATALISDLELQLGALAARAESTRGATVTTGGTYQIAGGQLVLVSPVVAAIAADLETTLGATSDAVNATVEPGGPIDGTVDGLLGGITDLINGLLPLPLAEITGPDVTATLDLDLAAAVDSVTNAPISRGGVTLDLANGTVLLDLSVLYPTLNGGLPANTVLLDDPAVIAVVNDAINDILTIDVPALLGGAIDTIVNTTAVDISVTAAVEALGLPIGTVDIALAGTLGGFLGNPGTTPPTVDLTGTEVLDIPIGVLLDEVADYVAASLLPAVGDVLRTALDTPALDTALDTIVAAAVTALGPLLAVVNEVVEVTVNVQEVPGTFRDINGTDDASSFTQRAVTISVAPDLAGSVITLNLASATVRALPLAPPAGLTITPDAGPYDEPTPVVITGDNLDDVTGITFGTVPVPPGGFTITPEGDIVTEAPAQAGPGVVDVVLTNPDGPSTGLTFEYYNVTGVDAIDPDNGTTAGGTTVTITGTCFTGATEVLFGGVAGTGLLVVDDTELTVVTPPNATPGLVDVTIVNPTLCGDETVPDGFAYVAPGSPVITGIDPDRGPEDGGTTVEITGTDFTGTTSVTFGGTEAADFEVVSDTLIEAETPAHEPGFVDVIVTSPVGPSAPFDFEFYDTVEITDVDPPEGPLAGGNTVTITGSCFTGAVAVLFGGVASPDITVVSDTEITAEVPAGADEGFVDVTVVGVGDCGTDTIDDGYEYLAPPVIDDVDPTEGPETGGTIVTITGTDLAETTGVTFDGVPGTGLTVIDDTEITITTPAHAPGVVPIVVVHPGGDTAAGPFEYLNIPTITDVVPGSGPEDGGTVVTITGEGFTGATDVTFDGIDGTDFSVDSDTQITVTTPPHAPAVVEVIVEHPNGDSAPGSFEYVAGTEIDTVTPDEGPEAGGTTVVITGVCFTGATDVLFDGVSAASFTVDSDTQITATTPPGVGVVDVTVVGSAACGTDTVPDGYEYLEPPVITDLDPTEGPEFGGTVVTITGTNLTDATGVTFDGIAGTAFAVVDDTEITVTTPAHAPGAVEVIVLHPGGNTDAGDFVYLNIPTITSLTPDTGPEDGGTEVIVSGEGFLGATAVTFDGIDGTGFTVDSDTQITVSTPAHVPATVDVVVEHPNGDSAPLAFTYVAGTEVSTVTPPSGPEAGGTTVVITGVCFTGATDVLFDGVSALGFTVDSDTQITAITPPGVGLVDVTVVGSAACGTDGLPDGYTYLEPPVITDVDPTEGPEFGGTVVTITGTNLTTATGVTFDGTPGTGFTVVDDTEITVVTPPHAPGLAPIVVQHPGGDTGAGDFAYLDVPAIASLDPTSGPEDGGTVVTITGEDFTGSTGVTFDGIDGVDFTVDSDTQITVTTPPHAPALVSVVVEHPNGDSAPGEFTYVAGTEIDTVVPPAGPEEGGTTVTLTGACFTGATGVFFGGIAAESFTVDSDTQITAVTPPGVGVVDVTVVGAAACGTDTVPDGYEYTDDPVIGSIDPARGPETGGTTVTIMGANLTGATSVTFGGVAGTSLTVVSATELTVVTPAHAPATVDVVVTTPEGASDPGSFTFFAVTGVDVVDPNQGPPSGGTTVTIGGRCFTGATAVLFGGTPAASFTVVSDTVIRAVSPAGTGTVSITVVGAGDCGSASMPNAFTYRAGLPVTGSADAGGWLLLALTLLAGGGLALAARRRRVA